MTNCQGRNVKTERQTGGTRDRTDTLDTDKRREYGYSLDWTTAAACRASCSPLSFTSLHRFPVTPPYPLGPLLPDRPALPPYKPPIICPPNTLSPLLHWRCSLKYCPLSCLQNLKTQLFKQALKPLNGFVFNIVHCTLSCVFTFFRAYFFQKGLK